MYIVHKLQPLPPHIEGLLDAVFLTVLVSPVLYYFFFRPMVRQIKLSKKAEEELKVLPDTEAKLGLLNIAKNAIYRPF